MPMLTSYQALTGRVVNISQIKSPKGGRNSLVLIYLKDETDVVEVSARLEAFFLRKSGQILVKQEKC